MIFRDRRDAGMRLAKALSTQQFHRPIVLALPRGGVPVAYEVARALGAPLDVVIVRKIGAPGNPEFGIGAIAENGSIYLRGESIEAWSIDRQEINRTISEEERELERRVKEFRGDRSLPSLRDRDVILVDDGLATGATAIASARMIQDDSPRRLILAVPVGAKDSIARLREEVDEVICLEAPAVFHSVGTWYDDFTQTTDQEVTALIGEARKSSTAIQESVIELSTASYRLAGDLRIPGNAFGLVLFAHGSGSSRKSPRNIDVAKRLNDAGLATLLFDLVSPQEARLRTKVFDIPFLATRLGLAIHWAKSDPVFRELPLGLFGASTGAAAALVAAMKNPRFVDSIVSRGGRPDLAGQNALESVTAPTLLIVGGNDTEVIAMNEAALKSLRNAELKIVPRATHLFEEPGAMEQVCELALEWFSESLSRAKSFRGIA